ncbi:MAG TPA: class I SAM-dependent methyltransferase [Verrucomicrobiota bacterium]|nr:class I SAM-dependent methyltransferase [Verrucomicrobiota bacterium]
MIPAPDYSRLCRVTSDCKPWPSGGTFGLCQACGLVQTIVRPQWRDEIQQIYNGYTIYHQSGGIEQPVFANEGIGTARSEAIIRALLSHNALPPSGRLLDIGCGNGGFLRSWSRLLPGWQLLGSEVSDKYRDTVEAIPGVAQLFTCPIEEIPGSFDCISLVHVLEHIPQPRPFLDHLRARLNPDGVLLIEVPDCQRNPFMLTVADHCSHFSLNSLRTLACAAHWEICHAVNDWIPRELTLVARTAHDKPAAAPLSVDLEESKSVIDGIRELARIAQSVLTLADRRAFGLFGTSVAATWLDAQTQRRAAFFVDEDPKRLGHSHENRPILSPAQTPADTLVFMALPQPWASLVATRLSQQYPAPRWTVP